MFSTAFKSSPPLFVAVAMAIGAPAALAAGKTDAATDTRGDGDQKRLQSAWDGSWISLTGTAKDVKAESFRIDYGKGEILVEMDDWDWYSESRNVLPQKKVTVTGRLDDDFFEQRKIEASSIYIPALSRYYYASAADEENGGYGYPLGAYWHEGDWISVEGRVSAVNQDDDELTIDTGARSVTVETTDTLYDTLEAGSDYAIRPGDRISVYGEVDEADLFEKREIEAQSVVVLSRDAGRSDRMAQERIGAGSGG